MFMTILQTLMPTQRMRRRKPPRELEGLLQSLQIGVSNGDSPAGPRGYCTSSGGKNALSQSKPTHVSRVLRRRGPFCVRRLEPHPPISTEKRNNQGLIELAVRRTGKRLSTAHTET